MDVSDVRDPRWTEDLTNSLNPNGEAVFRTGSRSVPLLVSIAALLFAISSVLLGIWGPEAFAPSPSALLSAKGANGSLVEPADRIQLALWLLFAVAGALVALSPIWRWQTLRAPIFMRLERALLAAATAVLIYAIFWRGHLWSGFDLNSLFVGLLILVLVVVSLVGPSWAARMARFWAMVISLTLAVPALLQLPGSVRDVWHFQFTADDLLAPAAGHFPGGDFTPLYSTLLGWPLVPLLSPRLGVQLILVLWIVLLQVIALVAAVSLMRIAGGKSLIAPSTVILLGPVVAVNAALEPTYAVAGGTGSFLSPSTYFQVFPLRVVLPVLALFVMLVLFQDRSRLDRQRTRRSVALGLVLGVVVLNNPDFGAPAALAVLLATTLAERRLRTMGSNVMFMAIGATAIFGTYVLIGLLSGSGFRLEVWLAFQRIFGASGYMNEPIDAFGPHVAVAVLFTGTFLTGLVSTRASVAHPSGLGRRQGLVTLSVGTWSLLCLPYFAGRSFNATLIGGFAFLVGLNVASLLPFMRRAWRAWIRNPSAGGGLLAASVIGLLAVTGAGMFWSLVKGPQEYFEILGANSATYSSVAAEEEATVRDLLQGQWPVEIADALNGGRVGQALDNSSMIELLTGLESLGVAKMPGEYMGSSPALAKLQCEAEVPSEYEYLLVTRVVADLLGSQRACEAKIDFERAVEVNEQSVILPLTPRPLG